MRVLFYQFQFATPLIPVRHILCFEQNNLRLYFLPWFYWVYPQANSVLFDFPKKMACAAVLLWLSYVVLIIIWFIFPLAHSIVISFPLTVLAAKCRLLSQFLPFKKASQTVWDRILYQKSAKFPSMFGSILFKIVRFLLKFGSRWFKYSLSIMYFFYQNISFASIRSMQNTFLSLLLQASALNLSLIFYTVWCVKRNSRLAYVSCETWTVYVILYVR